MPINWLVQQVKLWGNCFFSLLLVPYLIIKFFVSQVITGTETISMRVFLICPLHLSTEVLTSCQKFFPTAIPRSPCLCPLLGKGCKNNTVDILNYCLIHLQLPNVYNTSSDIWRNSCVFGLNVMFLVFGPSQYKQSIRFCSLLPLVSPNTVPWKLSSPSQSPIWLDN